MRLVENTNPSDKGVYSELINATLVIEEPYKNLLIPPIRKLNYRYQVAESLWNLVNTDSIVPLRHYMKGIDKYVQDQPESLRDRVLWSYGPSTSKNLWNAYRALRASSDRNSRRVVITIERPLLNTNFGTPPCLISVQWFIRDNALHQIINMRSNDVYRGLPGDLFQFSLWQYIMAAALEIPAGIYVHNAASLHLYASDLDGAQANMHLGRYMDQTPPGKFALSDVVDPLMREFLMNPVAHKGWRLGQIGLDAYLALLAGDYFNCPDEYKWLIEHKIGVGW